ncbi:hypothetical protein [Sphingobacterium hotanense]|uniref:hypothetical protein n=1 Tax=Sphingobacterium hotanense TaxID=649196 RepID=UPI0021A67B4B|nr:hypothetical protein [Sphingobacterium hotanense]MCT1524201.1 hypothetical protein [Sphingobacterium hotanense]
MKKHYLFVLFAVALTVFQTSCSKSDDDYENDTPELILVDDEPGKIAGLGDVGGELEGPMFKLPSGISSVGEIKGSDLDLNKVVSNRIGQSKTRSLNDQAARANFFALAGTFGADSIKGSGYLVSVAITLRNDNNADVQVAFPAGTILKSRSGKLQNGILVKKTTFLIPKNSQKRVHLFMYCGNYSRHASSPSEIYDWSVITTSRSLHNLFPVFRNGTP